MEIVFKPIGTVRTQATEAEVRDEQVDIKGYRPDYRTEYTLPGWYQRLMDEAGHI